MRAAGGRRLITSSAWLGGALLPPSLPKILGTVVTAAAKKGDGRKRLGLIGPLTMGCLDPGLACLAPCVGSRVARVMGPEEAHGLIASQAFDDVPAHERGWLSP